MTTLRTSILSDLRLFQPDAFVAAHIFDRVPHLFGGDRSRFIEWKGVLASGLQVDPADLTVVGSAALGVSLNPNKGFRQFGSHSDIDVAVISSFHFQAAWRFLRQNGTMRTRLSPGERAAWDEHRKNLVYWGTIAADRLLPRFPFGAVWRNALDQAERATGLDQPVKVRVYTDYEALRTYQVNSVKERQRAALLMEEQ